MSNIYFYMIQNDRPFLIKSRFPNEPFSGIIIYDESEKVWKLGEKYVPKDTKVDIKKAYYIAKSDDINFNKVYQYVNN